MEANSVRAAARSRDRFRHVFDASSMPRGAVGIDRRACDVSISCAEACQRLVVGIADREIFAHHRGARQARQIAPRRALESRSAISAASARQPQRPGALGRARRAQRRSDCPPRVAHRDCRPARLTDCATDSGCRARSGEAVGGHGGLRRRQVRQVIIPVAGGLYPLHRPLLSLFAPSAANRFSASALMASLPSSTGPCEVPSGARAPANLAANRRS